MSEYDYVPAFDVFRAGWAMAKDMGGGEADLLVAWESFCGLPKVACGLPKSSQADERLQAVERELKTQADESSKLARAVDARFWRTDEDLKTRLNGLAEGHNKLRQRIEAGEAATLESLLATSKRLDEFDRAIKHMSASDELQEKEAERVERKVDELAVASASKLGRLKALELDVAQRALAEIVDDRLNEQETDLERLSARVDQVVGLVNAMASEQRKNVERLPGMLEALYEAEDRGDVETCRWILSSCVALAQGKEPPPKPEPVSDEETGEGHVVTFRVWAAGSGVCYEIDDEEADEPGGES